MIPLHAQPGTAGHTLSPEEVETLARRRAGAHLGWWVHAQVFVAVNLGLALLAWLTHHPWVPYPALGWGLGLLLHGARVWHRPDGSGLQERLMARERARLAHLCDPW